MTAKRPGLLQARRPIAKSVLTERDRSPPTPPCQPREIIAKQSRRQVLRQLLVIAGVAAVGWSGVRSDLATSLLATHHTGVGEQSALLLADGSQVLMST